MSPHIRNIYEWRQSMKSNSRSLPRYLVSLELVLLAMASLSLGAQKHEADIRERLDASAAVLGQLITAPDRPIPKQVLPEARCIVVVPSLASFALGIGVRRGKGVATCRGTKDWSAPAPVAFTVCQASMPSFRGVVISACALYRSFFP